MKKKKTKIPENQYIDDFGIFSGFYDYHVENKKLDFSLEELQLLGVCLKPMSRKDLLTVDWSSVPSNTILFSSSKRKKQVKNLAWTVIRCLCAHPENIEQIVINDTSYYKIWCTTKDAVTNRIVPTMKGIVACDLWKDFSKGLTQKIKEHEEGYQNQTKDKHS